MLGIVAPVVGSGGAAVESWMAYDGTLDAALETTTRAATSRITPLRLSNTRAIVVYSDSSNSNYPTVDLLDADGQIIDSLVVNSAASAAGSVAAVLDATYFIVGYDGGSGGLRTKTLEAGGDTLSVVGSENNNSSEITVNSTFSINLDMVGITTTTIFCAFRNANASNVTSGCVLSVNTGTGAVTVGSRTTLDGNAGSQVRVLAATSTRVFSSTTSSAVAYIQSATISGTSVSSVSGVTGGTFAGSNLINRGLMLSSNGENLFAFYRNSDGTTGYAGLTVNTSTNALSNQQSSRMLTLSGRDAYPVVMDSDADYDYLAIIGSDDDVGTYDNDIHIRGGRMKKTSRAIQIAESIKDTTIQRGGTGMDRLVECCKMSASKFLIAAVDDTATQNRYYVANI